MDKRVLLWEDIKPRKIPNLCLSDKRGKAPKKNWDHSAKARERQAEESALNLGTGAFRDL